MEVGEVSPATQDCSCPLTSPSAMAASPPLSRQVVEGGEPGGDPGAIRLKANQTVRVDGVISADGQYTLPTEP